MLEQPLKFFVVFFVVVEPVSLIPLFSGLTAGAAPAYKRRMALKAVAIASAILMLFALGGASFLALMGISLESFRIFGGLLLFLLALEMVFAREPGGHLGVSARLSVHCRSRSARHDPAVVRTVALARSGVADGGLSPRGDAGAHHFAGADAPGR